jgi:hypothetical protein
MSNRWLVVDSTALFDAVWIGLNLLDTAAARRLAWLVISDGNEDLPGDQWRVGQEQARRLHDPPKTGLGYQCAPSADQASGVSASDPLTLAAVAAMLAFVALMASLVRMT